MNLQPPDPPEEDEGERWERHLLEVEAENARLHEMFLCCANELGLPVEADAPKVVEAIHALQLENGRLRGMLAELEHKP